MIFQGTTQNLSASAAVNVSSFVKMDPSNKYQVLQTTGPADLPIGVSQQGTFTAPGFPGGVNTLCTNPLVSATNPTQINVYGVGSVVRLQLSPAANAIVPGQLLCSDPNGLGIDIANALLSGSEVKYAGAIALSNGSPGNFVRVLVIAPFPLTSSGGSIRVSLTPTLIGPGAANDQTFTVAGLPGDTTAAVIVNGEALTQNIGIVNAHILAAGSLQIRFANFSGISLTPAVQFFDIGIIG